MSTRIFIVDYKEVHKVYEWFRDIGKNPRSHYLTKEYNYMFNIDLTDEEYIIVKLKFNISLC